MCDEVSQHSDISNLGDNQQYNDLYYQNKELKKGNEIGKRIVLQKIKQYLTNSSNVVSNDGLDRPNRIYSVKQKTGGLSHRTNEALLTNFESCCDTISVIQEKELLQWILGKLDGLIIERLKKSEATDSDRYTFEKGLKKKQSIEKGLEVEFQEMEKRIIELQDMVRIKKNKLKNFDREIELKKKTRMQSLKENTKHQIYENLSELEYLYSNDPQSLLEDADKYSKQIKEDIEMFKEKEYALSRDTNRVDPKLIERYFHLKKMTGKR